jgi:N-acetylneuraminic acid mutarotase
MKKFLTIVLIGALTVYFYYWYVRGVNLLISGDDALTLPPYTFATRLPPKPGVTPPKEEEAAIPRWEAAKPMPEPRSEVGAAAIGRTIYVVGGFDGFARTSSRVDAFDVENNAWYPVQPLPKALHHVGVASDGEKLYAFGGMTGIAMTAVDTLYVYEPALNRWKEMGRMPDPVGAAAIVLFEGKFHVLGGQGLGQSTQTHNVYDPKTDTWEPGEPLVTGRDHFGAAAIGGKIYVVGGRAGSLLYNMNALEVYDPDSKTWEQREPMPSKRSAVGTAVLDGKLYVFGGESTTSTFSDVETYDPKTDQWRIAPSMTVGRHGFGTVIVDGRVFIIGGGKRSGLSVTDLNEVFTP